MSGFKSTVWIFILGFLSVSGLATAQETGQLRQETGGYIERVEKVLQTDRGKTLYAISDLGSIKVDAWDRDEVRVVVEKRADVFTESEAKAVFADLQTLIRPESRGVYVRVASQSGRQPRSLSVRVHLTVPNGYHVDLQTGGGGIEIGDLEGNVKARTSGGGIQVGRVTNGSVDIETSGGGLTITSVWKGDARARTSGGGINVGQVSGNLDVQTSGGGITIQSAGKNTSARTAGGGIKVGASGGDLHVETAGGGITIGPTSGEVVAKTAGGGISIGPTHSAVTAETAGGGIRVDGSGGPVRVSTSGGSIKITEARGYIEARTAGGGIEAELVVADKAIDTHCTLETAGGNITIYLPENLTATVDAQLRIEHRVDRSYRIYSDFPLVIQGDDTNRITGSGDINGGGRPIRLSTVNGDIYIKKLRK